MSFPKILVIGHARHGKDVVGLILKDGWGLKASSSSLFAAEKVVYPELKDKFNYHSVEECFEDRLNCRPLWKQLISEYNYHDKTRLAKEILKENDIYIGMRCHLELEEAKRQKLFDSIVWVDSGYRKDPEPSNSITVTRGMADYVIDNNGDLNQLVIEVFKFMRYLNSKEVFNEKSDC